MEETNTQTTNTDSSSNTNTKMNPMLIGGVIVVLIAVGAIAILGKGAKNIPEPVKSPIPVNKPEDTSLVVDENVKVIKIEGGSFYFKPNEIRIKKGETVKIVLTSMDMMHDFVVDELNVRTNIAKAGDTTEVTLTPEIAGEFEFYCSVGNHRAQGMVGTLIIVEE